MVGFSQKITLDEIARASLLRHVLHGDVLYAVRLTDNGFERETILAHGLYVRREPGPGGTPLRLWTPFQGDPRRVFIQMGKRRWQVTDVQELNWESEKVWCGSDRVQYPTSPVSDGATMTQTSSSVQLPAEQLDAISEFWMKQYELEATDAQQELFKSVLRKEVAIWLEDIWTTADDPKFGSALRRLSTGYGLNDNPLLWAAQAAGLKTGPTAWPCNVILSIDPDQVYEGVTRDENVVWQVLE